MKKVYLFGLGVTNSTFADIQKAIIDSAKQRKTLTVFLANVHMLMEAKKSNEFNVIFNNADIVSTDGLPICFALRLLYNIKQERVAGMDLFPSLLEKAADNGLSVFLYGSDPETLNKVKERTQNLYKKLKIRGIYSPPFRNLTYEEELEVIHKINESNADIIFVALGCPKQEKLIHLLRKKVCAVMIGVGGAFPVFAQTVNRSPKWMQHSGLEWLYRLFQEPRRLFFRYATTNTMFIYLLMKDCVKKLIKNERFI